MGYCKLMLSEVYEEIATVGTWKPDAHEIQTKMPKSICFHEGGLWPQPNLPTSCLNTLSQPNPPSPSPRRGVCFASPGLTLCESQLANRTTYQCWGGRTNILTPKYLALPNTALTISRNPFETDVLKHIHKNTCIQQAKYCDFPTPFRYKTDTRRVAHWKRITSQSSWFGPVIHLCCYYIWILGSIQKNNMTTNNKITNDNSNANKPPTRRRWTKPTKPTTTPKVL